MERRSDTELDAMEHYNTGLKVDLNAPDFTTKIK